MQAGVVSVELRIEGNRETLQCTECGREPDVHAHAAGWVAFRVDLADDPDPPEVVVYCAECAKRELGER